MLLLAIVFLITPLKESNSINPLRDPGSLNESNNLIVGQWKDQSGRTWEFAANGDVISEGVDSLCYGLHGSKLSLVFPFAGKVAEVTYEVRRSGHDLFLELQSAASESDTLPAWLQTKMKLTRKD